MLGESVIITSLLLIIVLGLIRAKRRNWATATLPLMVVPSVNCLIKPVCDAINTTFTFDISVWALLIAVMVSCVWVGFLTGTLLNKRKYRVLYMIGCILFNVLLAGTFIFDYYKSFGFLG